MLTAITVSLVCLLGAGLGAPGEPNNANLDGFGVDPFLSIRPLLPESTLLPGKQISANADAAAHRAALERSGLHAKSFWVVRVDGDAEARNVVFLIPQYHRNPTMPIAWTSLGKEIADVQTNIDALVTHLINTHRLHCIGTEGSSQYRIRRSPELQKLARWNRDLRGMADVALDMLGSDAATAKPLIDAMLAVLLPELRQTFLLLDGAGMAQGRLESPAQLRRFGLEEEAVNAQALKLLNDLKVVEDELAFLEPNSQPAANDALGKLWLNEIGVYDKEVLAPLRAVEPKFHALRKELTAAGIDDGAEALGRFIALSKLVIEEVIMPEEVRSATVHYVAVKRASRRRRSSTSLTADEQRRRAVLVAQRSRINSAYSAVTHYKRDRIAAERVIEQLALQPAEAPRTCAVVMGTGHEKDLSTRLLALAKTKKLGPLAIIVVAPFEPAD